MCMSVCVRVRIGDDGSVCSELWPQHGSVRRVRIVLVGPLNMG